MNNFALNQNYVVTDQTILSGLGLSPQFDLSIDISNCREPSATSTAVTRKDRDDYLQLCSEKENEFLKIVENFTEFRHTNEKNILKDVTQSRNIPDEFIDLKEFSQASNREASIQNAEVERCSSNFSNSDLFPGSSILTQSRFSFSDDNEVDLKKENSSKLGLPSFLIGGSNQDSLKSESCVTPREKAFEENLRSPWGMESILGFDTNHLQKESFNVPSPLSNMEMKSAEANFPLSFATNEKNERMKVNPFDQVMVEEVESNSFENEKFHNIDFRELSLDEEKVLNRDSFYIGNSFTYASNKSDFSGIVNPDITVKSSLLNVEGDTVNPKEKLRIEDIFRAKSTKPSFGYKVDTSDLSHFVPIEVSESRANPFSSSANTLGSQVSLPVTNQNEAVNSLSCFRSEDNAADHSLNLDLLRQIIEGLPPSSNPKDLIEKISQSNKDDITLNKESILSESSSEETREIKIYKERLKNIIFKDDPHFQGTSEVNFSNVNERNVGTDFSAPNRIDEASKNISQYFAQPNISEYSKTATKVDMVTHSYQPLTTELPSIAEKREPILPIKENNFNQDCNSIRTFEESFIQRSQITKDSITGLQTDIEFQLNNPTSMLLALTVNQEDEIFKHENPSQSANKNCYNFDYARTDYLFPNSCLNFSLCFCSLMPGIFVTTLRFCVSECNNVTQALLSQVLQISVTVQTPDIQIISDKDNEVDFGLVPECCVVTKRILVVNRSKHFLPVFITLKPVLNSSEILTWVEDQPKLKLLSPSIAACEIKAENSINVTARLSAPTIEVLQRSGVVEIESSFEVTLDSPFQSNRILWKVPVKAAIGEVLLRTMRSILPLRVEAVVDKVGICSCTLRNKSMFPLNLSIKLSDHEQFLKISPERLLVPSQEDALFEVLFSPTHDFHYYKVETKVLIVVEPNGMQLDLPCVATVILSSNPKNQIQEVLPLPTSKPPPPTHTETPLSVKDSKTDNQVLTNQPVSLLTNGHYCMFGTVPIGESKSYKFIVQNGWTHDNLHFEIRLNDSEDFYFSDGDGEPRLSSKEITLSPKEKVNVMINFTPTKREVYSSSLLCIYKNTEGKTSFPLYGFGGSGEFILKHGESLLSSSNELSFGSLMPGVNLLKLSGTNTGTRYIFVKFRILPDENCDEPFSQTDMNVQPMDLILGPGESKEIIIFCMGTSLIMERAHERFGILRVIYGDEVLRRRFRKHNDAKLKLKKINNRRLLRINFHDEIPRENVALLQEEKGQNLPLLADDAVVFYNGCKSIDISLCREVQENEISTTMVHIGVDQTSSNLFINKTMKKFTDADNGKGGKNVKQAPSSQLSSNSVDFDVFPPELTLKTSLKDPASVSVVNYSCSDQVLEASCEESFLSITPTEVTISPKCFTVFKVNLIIGNLPRNLPKVTSTFQILGPNHQRKVHVTVEVDSSLINNDKYAQPTKIPMLSRKQEGKVVSNLPLQTAKATAKTEQSSSCPKDSQSEQKKYSHGKEVHLEIPTDLSFPDTKLSKESAAKLTVSNFSSDTQEVKLSMLGSQFYIRHQIVKISGRCKIDIPLFFRPRARGEIIDIITIHVLSTKQEHHVRLRGKCI